MNNNIYYADSSYLDSHQANRYNLPPNANKNVYFSLFTKTTIDYISDQITQRLDGVHPLGKNIIVPNKTIISVLDSHYTNYKRDTDALIMMTISYLVEYIKSEYQIEEQNKSLNIWITNFPESSGMRQHPEIKLRNKRPTPFQFHFTY